MDSDRTASFPGIWEMPSVPMPFNPAEIEEWCG